MLKNTKSFPDDRFREFDAEFLFHEMLWYYLKEKSSSFTERRGTRRVEDFVTKWNLSSIGYLPLSNKEGTSFSYLTHS
jgi:hypothetical protein